jgi:hypothetical protein
MGEQERGERAMEGKCLMNGERRHGERRQSRASFIVLNEIEKLHCDCLMLFFWFSDPAPNSRANVLVPLLLCAAADLI